MTGLEEATLGMGCFWNSEETLANTKGIKVTEVGFMGKDKVEVVRLQFDPKIIEYNQILSLFFNNHDTSVSKGNEQSVIFFRNRKQKIAALESRANYRTLLKIQVNTKITRVSTSPFYRKASEEHQKHYQKGSS